jgi:peptide/nickel transport system substrate-binding protein
MFSGYNRPYNLTQAKQLVAAAGYNNWLNLTVLYLPASTVESKMAQTLQSDLASLGVKIKRLSATPSDFYVKYLEVPSVAKRGVWDLSIAGWGPDWYRAAAASFFQPILRPNVLPAPGRQLWFYGNPSVTSLIAKGASAALASAAATIWGQADGAVMKDGSTRSSTRTSRCITPVMCTMRCTSRRSSSSTRRTSG